MVFSRCCAQLAVSTGRGRLSRIGVNASRNKRVLKKWRPFLTGEAVRFGAHKLKLRAYCAAIAPRSSIATRRSSCQAAPSSPVASSLPRDVTVMEVLATPLPTR
jgi:hypothetical protein